MTSLSELVEVVIGVDTHVNTHTAAVVVAGTGAVLASITVETTAAGYQQLLDFADLHTPGTRAWALEGTGGHGAGLTRVLHDRGELVIEIDRPQRVARRNGAKSDDLDAVRAAREALARTWLATPRAAGDRQALSVLLAARDSAVQAAGDAQRQVFSQILTAPDQVRDRLRDLTPAAAVAALPHMRVHAGWDLEARTVLTVLKALARRVQALTAEAKAHEDAIRAIVTNWRPDLLQQTGVGPICAAIVLCAWSHPGRIHSEAAFAMLAGVAPIPATSGQTQNRHRLNRYGDRRLNKALHTIALSRSRFDTDTRDYIARRTTEGKTTREIRRCLKRYIARDLYRILQAGA